LYCAEIDSATSGVVNEYAKHNRASMILILSMLIMITKRTKKNVLKKRIKATILSSLITRDGLQVNDILALVTDLPFLVIFYIL
jgi:hypothetical protein